MSTRGDYYMKRFLQEQERNATLKGFLARAIAQNQSFEVLTADMQAEINRLNAIIRRMKQISKPDSLRSEITGGPNVTSR